VIEGVGSALLKPLVDDGEPVDASPLLGTVTFDVRDGGAAFAVRNAQLHGKARVRGVVGVGEVDVGLVDTHYLHEDTVVAKHMMEQPSQATPADQHILSDKSQFRVFEQQGGFSSARSSYFHHSLGGYHAAKPKKIQDLYDYQIAQQNIEVLNMLNIKYVIGKDEQGQDKIGRASCRER